MPNWWTSRCSAHLREVKIMSHGPAFFQTKITLKTETCQKNKFIGPYIKAPFQETETRFQLWDKIDLDIVAPLNMIEGGHKYILTCQDNLINLQSSCVLPSRTAFKYLCAPSGSSVKYARTATASAV